MIPWTKTTLDVARNRKIDMYQQVMSLNRKLFQTIYWLSESRATIFALLLAAVTLTTAGLALDHYAKNNNSLMERFHGQYIDATRVFNVGDIPSGGLSPFQFEVQNTSQISVRLLKGRSSCTCILEELSKDTISPGEIALIKGWIEGKGKEGPDTQRFAIRAEPLEPDSTTDSDVIDNVVFVVSGNLRADRGLRPSSMKLKVPANGLGIVKRPFEISWEASEDEKLETEFSNLPPGMAVEISPEPQRVDKVARFRGQITVDSSKIGDDGSHLNGYARFRLAPTTKKDPLLFKLYVSVDVVSDVIANPNILTWSQSDGPTPANLTLEAADGVLVKIDDIKYDHSILECSVTTSDAGVNNLMVNCLVKEARKMIRSELRIDVRYGTDQQKKTIVVPVLIL
jgi:hypothetical protein